jgi:hypothetical protein
LPLPVEGLQIEAPQPHNIRIVFVVLPSEEVHHVIIDDCRVGVDVAEGIVIEKIGQALCPELGRDVVTVDCALLVEMVFGFLLRNSSVNIE